MKIKELPVYPGGLMRCCTQTLNERADDEVQEGDLIACNYEKGEPTMIVKDHAIQWIGSE